MSRDRNLSRPTSQSFPRSLFSSDLIPSWDDVEEKMARWFGKDAGVSISEDDQNVYIESHLPGLQADDIEVSLDRNTLRIVGEKKDEEVAQDKRYHRRAQKSFFYQVELPTAVEENTEQAEYQDGVLHITFKKAHKENIKRIAVRNKKESSTTRSTSQQRSSTTTPTTTPPSQTRSTGTQPRTPGTQRNK